MKKQKYFGRGALITASLVLMVLSGWEVCIRLDAIYPPLKMFFSMALGEGIPLAAALNYFDYSIFEAPVWLLGCILISLLSVFLSSRKAGCILLLPVSGAMALYGLTRSVSFFVDFWRLVQPALLIAICALSAVNLLTLSAGKKKSSPHLQPAAPRITDAPRLRAIAGGGKQKSSSRNAG